MQGVQRAGNAPTYSSQRGMSSAVAAIILAVVVVIGGAGTFAALSSVHSSTTSKSTCSPTCSARVGGTNDVTLFVPYTVGFGQMYSQVAVGNSIQASVGVTGSETIQSFAVTWAPGVTTTGPTGSLTYTYGTTGLYTVSATATTPSGVVHTGTGQLVALKVNPSSGNLTLGYFPTISTTLKNTTGGPYGWIGAGGTVTVNGTYTTPPANALYTAAAPTLTVPKNVTQSGLVSGTNYASATYTFPSAGYYGITLVVPVSDAASTVLYQNFTWGIYVGATATGLGCPLCHAPVEASPHPGTFVNYEVLPGGALSLDPAADYYSVGYEVGEGFDESLIELNGTDSGGTYQNFVPEVATCVPGSPLCTKLYGETLQQGNNFTFVIDPAAHFYDPTSKASREVYPSDVMFSIIRAIFGTQVEGATGYYVGFDIAGPLVPYQPLEPTEVNLTWDPGPGTVALHAPYNNTPYWVYNSMAVNDTTYCPKIAMSQDNGCITFHADADGRSWPATLLILSIISADGIQASGWYTAQGAGVPGFVCSATDPDAPCLLPGDTNSTNTSAFRGAVATMSPTAFDADEALFTTGYPDPYPSVGFNEVGSGPYYLAYANPGVGYTLKANPAYQAPTGCKGQTGCLPLPGTFVPNVITYWDSTDLTGISEAEAGYADTAQFETPDYGTMLGLVTSGQLGLIDFPTLITNNFGFNTNIDLGLLATFDTSPPHPINIPATAFAYEGLRATLEYAYPYLTAQTLGNVAHGIDLGSGFGGFLPPSESAFYNASTPWPNYNNVTHAFSNPTLGSPTTVGTAEWYWDQTYNVTGGPLSDPLKAEGYTASNPLYIPVLGFTSTPNVNAVEVAWGHSVSAITGGVVQFQQFFVPSTTEDFYYTAPSEVPWALWYFTWIPDYPAPVNNWEGAYGTGLWGAADADPQTFEGVFGGYFNNTTCGHANPTLANMTYWADYTNQIIPQVCQGTAWNVTTYFVTQATFTPDFTKSVQLWGLIQDVYNNLQVTVGTDAQNVVFDYAPWINPSSINTNVLIGGGYEWYYQALEGNGIV